jgi:hypothetical protein
VSLRAVVVEIEPARPWSSTTIDGPTPSSKLRLSRK